MGSTYVKTASPTNHQDQSNRDVILDCSLSNPYIYAVEAHDVYNGNFAFRALISFDCVYGFDRLQSRKT